MNSNPGDEDLIAGCRQGEGDACRVFFHRFKHDVAKIAYNLLGRCEGMEDVIQKIFLDVFSSLKKFRGDCKIQTWIYRIAANVCADEIKTQSRLRRLSRENFIHEYNQTFSNRTALDQLEVQELAERVDFLLQDIGAKKRVAFSLYVFGEKSIAEISEVLCVPPGTVKFRIFEARREIQAKLKEFERT